MWRHWQRLMLPAKRAAKAAQRRHQAIERGANDGRRTLAARGGWLVDPQPAEGAAAAAGVDQSSSERRLRTAAAGAAALAHHRRSGAVSPVATFGSGGQEVGEFLLIDLANSIVGDDVAHAESTTDLLQCRPQPALV